MGYKDGRPVAEHSVRTPGEAERVEIDYLRSGVGASQNDLLMVYVYLQDAQGTVCFGENGREVTLEVIRGGELRSSATVPAEAGVATFLVATADAKALRLKAVSGPLEQEKTLKLTAAKLYR